MDDEDEVIVVIAEELGERLAFPCASSPCSIYHCSNDWQTSTGKLCSNVGGPAHVHKLLLPLELLICGEDNNVRNMVSFRNTGKSLSSSNDSSTCLFQSARSVEHVVECMSDENLCAHFYPFLTKLANKDW